MNVVEYKKIKETNKNILAKIKNLYYYNKNFCDSFLAEHSKEDWRIQLNAKYGTNQKKIFLSKSQIEFLIEKMRELGYNEGYLYPHDYPGHWVEQQYLPDKMVGTKYYIKDENIK